MKPPTEAYCSACRKWIPIALYRWGQYRCKACDKAYHRSYYFKKKAEKSQ